MAKFLIEYAMMIMLFLLIITQVIIPAFVPSLEFWWLFKPKKNLIRDTTSLEEKIDKLSEEAQQVRSEADEAYQKAYNIKNKSTKI